MSVLGISAPETRAAPRDPRRAALRAIRSLPALRNPKTALTTGGPLLRGLDEEGLAFAAQNPAYPESSREAARLALSARLGAPAARRLIESFVDALPARPWLRPGDLQLGDETFFGLGLRLRRIAAVAALVGAGPLLGLALSAAPIRDKLLVPALALFLALAAVWLVAVTAPRRRARVLLLRRYASPDIDGALVRLTGRVLAPFGCVLAPDVDPPRLGAAKWLPAIAAHPLAVALKAATAPAAAVWRLFDRSRFGPLAVSGVGDFGRLSKRLADRAGLSLDMAFAARGAIPVKAAAGWRRGVLRLLVGWADVVVVDLSEIDGLSEIWPLLDESVRSRIVFVAHEAELARAQNALAARAWRGTPIATFSRKGAKNEFAFRDAVLAALRQRLGAA